MKDNLSRIGIFFPSPKLWMGGCNYYYRLISLLKDTAPSMHFIVFVEVNLQEDFAFGLNSLPNVTVVPLKSTKQSYLGLFLSLFLGKDLYFDRIMRENEIDVVFSNAIFFGWRTNIKVLSWVPDLQHIYLPEMFSRLTKLKRDIGFSLQAKFSDGVILSSYDARNSFLKYYSVDKNKVYVVPFSVNRVKLNETTINETKIKYNINNDYVFLPNQYWPHKNHKIVIQALSLLKNNNKESYQVISTGSTSTDTFKEVEKLVSYNNISDKYLILGLIPFDDVNALMAGASYVLNPSLFEGWSTVVEEAKSTQKRLILSDIPIHREQVPIGARFFKPNDIKGLAVFLTISDNVSDKVNYGSNDERQKNFSAAFIDAIKFTLN